MAELLSFQAFLEVNAIPFERTSAAQIAQVAEQGYCVQAHLLEDQAGWLLALTLFGRKLDMDVVQHCLKRNFVEVDPSKVAQPFEDCRCEVVAPCAVAYGFDAVIDEAVMACDYVYLSCGRFSRFYRVTTEDLLRLQGNALLGLSIVKYPAEEETAEQGEESGDQRRKELLQRLETQQVLPPMPSMLPQLIALRADPNSDARKVSDLIGQDPSLAAQVMRHANSALFGFRGSITSLKTAIAQVLGVEMVLNLAIGSAMAGPFRIPNEGPMGLIAFQRHAIFTAEMSVLLARMMSGEDRPLPSTAYLAGLLHNIGRLLLMHWSPAESRVLGRRLEERENDGLLVLEQSLFGANHAEMGGWLLEAWGLSQPFTVAAREHHNVDYAGPESPIAHVVLLANRCLADLDIGDEITAELDPVLLERCGLSEEAVYSAIDSVLERQDQIKGLALALCA